MSLWIYIVDSILLTILYIVLMSALRTVSKSKVMTARTADDVCAIRKTFTWTIILSAVIYAVVFVWLAIQAGNYKSNAAIVIVLLTWVAFQTRYKYPFAGRRPNNLPIKYVLYLNGGQVQKDQDSFSEAELLYFLKQYLPVYRIAMSKDLSLPIDSYCFLDESSWMVELERIMEKATMIVVRVNASNQGIIEAAGTAKYKTKTVYVADDSDQLAKARVLFTEERKNPLPILMKRKSFNYWNDSKKSFNQIIITSVKCYKDTVKEIMGSMFSLRRILHTKKSDKIHTIITSVLCILSLIVLSFIENVGVIHYVLDVSVFIILLLISYIVIDPLYRMYAARFLDRSGPTRDYYNDCRNND